MRRIIFGALAQVWIAIGLCSIAYAQAQEKFVLTLDKAISIALEQNRDILIADQDRERAGAQIAEARSGAFPQVSLSAQYIRNIKIPVLFLPPGPLFGNTTELAFPVGSNNSYQGGLTLTQAIYSHQINVALDIANTYKDLSDAGYESTRQSVILQVKKAFYGVLLMQKLVDANRQGLDMVKANYENIQSLYKHGQAAEFDLLRAEVQVANTEPTVISVENNLVLAANGLKSLLSIPLDSDVVIKGDFMFTEVPETELDQGARDAMTLNPSLQQLAFQETMLDQNISVEQSGYFPSVFAFGSYQWETQDNTFQFNNYLWAKIMNVGVTLSWNIFDGMRTPARVEQAKVDLRKVQFTRLKAEEGITIQIQSARLKMNEAKQRIQGQEKNIEQAKKAVSIAETRFKNGVGTQLELLDTQVAMTLAQTNYAQAIYDYLVAKAEWEFAIGQGSK
ncbi:MAG TPA: TolC family protein [Candidatus Acidoferrales bacterium]|nr:TolC family protein [Candidatus Acidoferrales bacterium]